MATCIRKPFVLISVRRVLCSRNLVKTASIMQFLTFMSSKLLVWVTQDYCTSVLLLQQQDSEIHKLHSMKGYESIGSWSCRNGLIKYQHCILSFISFPFDMLQFGCAGDYFFIWVIQLRWYFLFARGDDEIQNGRLSLFLSIDWSRETMSGDFSTEVAWCTIIGDVWY